jgi:hypothetical protein
MGAPARIQRQRTKGWRMPEGAIYVGRPSKWGNDFPVGGTCTLDIGGHVTRFTVRTPRHAVDLFRSEQAPGLAPAARRELAGHDLACWCPEGQPCHADVLLELANGAS